MFVLSHEQLASRQVILLTKLPEFHCQFINCFFLVWLLLVGFPSYGRCEYFLSASSTNPRTPWLQEQLAALSSRSSDLRLCVVGSCHGESMHQAP